VENEQKGMLNWSGRLKRRTVGEAEYGLADVNKCFYNNIG
jgi:hypothetical protein